MGPQELGNALWALAALKCRPPEVFKYEVAPQVGWLAGRQAGWLAGRQAGWLAGWQAGWLAGRP
jgi:hypothetical protein